MGAVVAVEIGVAVAGMMLKSYEQRNQAEAQKDALTMRGQQEQLAAEQKENQRAQKLQEVMSTQIANQGASGLSFSSPSFNAIQIDSINKFAADEKLDELNNQWQQAAITQQKDNIDDEFIANLGSNLFSAASFAANASGGGGGGAGAATAAAGSAGGGGLSAKKKSPIEDDDDYSQGSI